MIRGPGWSLAVLLFAAAAACVGPQYDATPDFGDDATDEADTEAGSESESATEGWTDAAGDAEPCPDLAPREDDVQAAREAFREGVSAFTGEQWADAALAFCRAYAAHPAHQIWFNVAKCHAALGDAGRAVTAFERFLAEGGDAIPPAMRAETLAEIERLRAQRRGDE